MDYAASILGRLPRGKRSIGLNQLLSRLQSYLSPDQVAEIVGAYEFGAEAHEGQKRLSGEPYISHPVAVASILADLHLDTKSIQAAILHDVIEDTETAKEQIVDRFGDEVALLVDGVSKLDQIRFHSQAEAQAENFRKMMLAMVEDIRVILVKLADRLHNMRTLGAMPPAKRRRIARETLEIYAPIANRLGINSMKVELEELGFRVLYPFRSKVIERTLKKSRGNQRQIVKKISENLSKTLKDAGIPDKVVGREKHLYSIYKKMRDKGRSLNEIVDVFGFRIIVDSVDTSYRVLGVVHRLYKPMPGRFKDYIAIPRINGYQSLHTTLFGPNGVPLEVQIRTEDMNRVAESGIAAHWQYKDGEIPGGAPQARTREWLTNLLEMPTGDSEEFLESVKVDLFPDKVYVFTPNGDIKRLPRGATAVDFAYSVHTDVGNRCVAAKIDRRLVPLRTQLKNGQTVEIITARGAKPNPAWVNFVATAKARAAIRQYLKNLKGTEAADLGKRLLEQALKEYNLSIRKLSRTRMQALLKEFGHEERTQLYQQLGLGERLAPLVAKRLIADPDNSETGGAAAPLAIAGTEGMVVTYGRCCRPIPDDPIVGYLSAGRGVVIHRDNCGNLVEYRKQQDKWVAVEWEKGLDQDFTAEIRVETANRPGVLAAVAANIASTESNIEHVSIIERDGDTSSMTFVLQVKNRRHLARVMRAIRAMPNIYRVARATA